MTSPAVQINTTRDIHEREHDHDHEQDDISTACHVRKKIRTSVHLSTTSPPPLPGYTLEDHMTRTSSSTPHNISPTTISTAVPTPIPVLMTLNTSTATLGSMSTPSPPSATSLTSIAHKSTHPLQTLAQTQQQQIVQSQKSSALSTPIYTIDDFITRFACKLQFLDYSIKNQMHKIDAVKNDPSQEQRYRDLYLGLTNLEAKVRTIEDKIEDLFKLKISK